MTDERRAWVVLLVALACIGLGHSMLFSVLPPVARSIGLTPFQVSTIFACSATVWVVASPWWGRRSDVRGRRPIILIGLLGFALSTLAVALAIELGLRHILPVAATYASLIVARALFSLLGSGSSPAAMAYIAERTARHERTAGVALFNGAMGVGEALGPALCALLSALALLAPLYVSAALALGAALLVYWRLPEAARAAAADGPPQPRLRLFDTRVTPFVLISAVVQAARATTIITLAFFLQDTLALSPARTVQFAGLGFFVFAAAGLLAQLAIVQRLHLTVRHMLHLGVPLSVVSYLLLARAESLAACLFALSVMGVGLGLVRPGTAAGASLSVGIDEQGAVAGLVNGVAVAGNIAGPLVATSLYAATPVAPYLLNAGLFAAAWALLFANRHLRHLRA